MALALLAADWVARRGGRLLALVVDHGLRPEAASEAAATLERLAGRGIPGVRLDLSLARGARLAERARSARHAALEVACAERGLLHLLLGHHAADQAETVAMRRLRQSGPAGLAGMAALRETARVRLLRPLLDIPPVRLRETLLAAELGWVEDPSNADPTSERARLRALARDRDGCGPLTWAAVDAATRRGQARAAVERTTALWLGRHVSMFPDGRAIVAGSPIPPAALAALIAAIGGGARMPPSRQVDDWLAAPRAATLGGAQISLDPPGWRIEREARLRHSDGSAMVAATEFNGSLTTAPFLTA